MKEKKIIQLILSLCSAFSFAQETCSVEIMMHFPEGESFPLYINSIEGDYNICGLSSSMLKFELPKAKHWSGNTYVLESKVPCNSETRLKMSYYFFNHPTPIDVFFMLKDGEIADFYVSSTFNTNHMYSTYTTGGLLGNRKFTQIGMRFDDCLIKE